MLVVGLLVGLGLCALHPTGPSRGPFAFGHDRNLPNLPSDDAAAQTGPGAIGHAGAVTDRASRPGGILLTGGASRRMGFDKTMLLIDGVPCAERIGRLLAGVLDVVVEVGPGRSSLPAVREEPPGMGPLAAVVAGYQWINRTSPLTLGAVVVAGDLPMLSEAVLNMLADWPGEDSVVPVVAGRAQTLLARWSAEALRRAEALVERGTRSMLPLLEGGGIRFVEEAQWPKGVEASAFGDVDTVEDLERLGLQP